MPLLQQEPSIYPADLFDGGAQGQGERRLRVLHTKPRQEKSLSRQLYNGQIPFYLPLISRRLRYQARRLTSHVPLFSSYVFLFGDDSERLAALKTARVVSILDVGDQDKLWFDLRQISQLIQAGAPITPEDRLAPGAAVEIQRGPLAGLKGRIVKSASGHRFVVAVDFIQRGASVLVDDDTLAVCDESELDEPNWIMPKDR